MIKSYYERNKKNILKKMKKKYQDDLDFRAKIKEKYKNKYHEDTDYRIATIQRAKANYQKVRESVAS